MSCHNVSSNSLQQLLLGCPALPAQETGSGTVAVLTPLWVPDAGRERTKGLLASPGTCKPLAPLTGHTMAKGSSASNGPVRAKAEP